MKKIPSEIAELLDTEAARINSPAFISADPVQFPRRFSKLEDIEIVSLLASAVAWGKRTMICRNVERILSLMDYAPHAYLLEKGFEDIDDSINLHRTFFGRHFKYMMRGLYEIYTRFGSLDAFSEKMRSGESETPAWHLVAHMQKVMQEANDGQTCSQALPVNLDQTALKRFNMALRWLVRDDGIVDMGVWKSIPKSKLYIPLDVHVGNTARELGLLTRRSNDRKSVEQLTELLRTLRPEDPCIYDYALFGIGVGVPADINVQQP